MRILADENCDRLWVSGLRAAGHDVKYVADDEAGEADIELFLLAQREGRVLLSSDLDFGRLAELAKDSAPGIILLRLHTIQRAARAKRVVDVLRSLGEVIEGQVVVIEPGQVRVRAFAKLQRR